MIKKVFFIPLFMLSISYAAPIKSIKFNGLVHLSSQMAGEITNLQVGKDFDYAIANRAIKLLYKQGYFNDIWIDEDGGNVVVNVEEKPVIAMIEFKGVSDDDKKVLKDMIGLSKGMTYDSANIQNSKNRIKEYFEAKGYFQTVVEESATPLEERSSLKVLFQINRGENIIIRDITLSGSKKLDYDDVEPSIYNKQREFMGWLWGRNDGKLKLQALPIDASKIKDDYLAKGFLDASVSNPFLRVNYDDFNANIIYNVIEGEQYHVSDITLQVDGDEGVISLGDIEDDLLLEKDSVFNVKKLRKDMKLIETKVADEGYAFVKVYPQSEQDKKSQSVHINYVVVPGEKVRIRRVLIGGNTRTADHVIRREVYSSEGDLYSRTNLNDTKNALKRTGYFDDVEVKEKRVSENSIDLFINVKEAPTGSISGGIGYGTSNGVMLDASIADQNVFGSGMSATIKGSRSEDSLSGKISLTNPRVRDSIYSLSGSLYAQENDWSAYDQTIRGGSLTVGRKIGRYTHTSLGYVIENSTLEDLATSLKEVGYEEGKSLKSALIPSITFNNTDDYYLPRHGFIASTSLEYAGVGGDEKFIKSTTSFSKFYGLEDMIGWDLILRYKARYRYVWDKGYLPIDERLYLGGIGSVRGYDSRSIGPKNSSGYETGGIQSFNNSFEISFPLIKRIKMRGALFYDYGIIADESNDSYYRTSTGFALEWLSPLGPIELIFARPLNDEPGDDISRFEFMIGRRF